ncbi:hypothetical protein MNEG_4562 [Monoraphidium neglectum]|uniref:Uncharacterized protein n=1 Tax=Monoraphidium neglectum TaxID=145388 RepID=A0A0D2MSJ7_9CHLO|nr:hypothetical protein MNEG_4562 [Monoraphidium neglectum]KIZ03402.1 hypothetical protein MNEG_4562 [Monoraphidium neglectum]|eukprot:XP_013902421.1 hypothetical protein MNEG_4562 [Monoraphidium neglectum]
MNPWIGPAGAAADAGAGAATSSSLLQRLASQWATSLHDEKQHEDRAFSGSLCSTSGAGVQQRRCFAKKGSGGAAPKAAANAGAGGGSAPPAVGDDTSPPTYRAARPSRGDPLRQLPESQVGAIAPRGVATWQLTWQLRKLLQALAPPGEKLRTPRQIGWDLGPAQSMALLHETLRDGPVNAACGLGTGGGAARVLPGPAAARSGCASESSTSGLEVAGAPVLYTPFVVTDIFQSAQAVAEWLKMVLELGEDFSSIERFFVQVLATEPRPDVRGIKVQIKGRLAGKGGKATKKVCAGVRVVFLFGGQFWA